MIKRKKAKAADVRAEVEAAKASAELDDAQEAPGTLQADIHPDDVDTRETGSAKARKPNQATLPERPATKQPHREAHADTLDTPNSQRKTVQEQGDPQHLGEVPSRIAELPIVGSDRYKLHGQIARGGLGRIIKAFDRHLKRTVALKELRRHDPHSQNRFLREMRISAALAHPNIVSIHSAGRWKNGRPFYTMTMVVGRTLTKAFEAERNLAGRLGLLRHVIDVADAIAYAHSERVIHRDLKPDNIMLGPFGETVVLDWGLAKHLDADDEPDVAPLELSQVQTPDGDAPPQLDDDHQGDAHQDDDRGEPPDGADPSIADDGSEIGQVVSMETAAGVIVGTPSFMAPEQARAERVDERTDVYALGAIL